MGFVEGLRASGRRKGFALKNLDGALPTDGIGCNLLVSRESKMEIPDRIDDEQENRWTSLA